MTAKETGPSLTTIFTPPPDCFNGHVTIGVDTYDSRSNGVVQAIQNTCWPPYWREYDAQALAGMPGIYSPGVCPDGFTTVRSRVDSFGSADSNARTDVTCCPPRMHLTTVGDDPGGPTWCSMAFWDAATIVNGSVTTTSSLNHMYQSIFQVAWQANDLSKFSPLSAPLITNSPSDTQSTTAVRTTPATPGNANSASITPTPTNTATSSSVSSIPVHHGLSTGAKAGIGIGASIAGLVILAGILYFGKKRRAQRMQSDLVHESKPEMDVKPTRKTVQIEELGQDGHIYEANGVGRPIEVDDRNAVAELPCNWRGHEAPVS